MKSFIIVNNEFDCAKLCGKVNLAEFTPILYDSVSKAMEDLNPNTQYILEIRFKDENEVREGVMASYFGNTKHEYRVELVRTILIKNNEGLLCV